MYMCSIYDMEKTMVSWIEAIFLDLSGVAE
jgi:hypothetical protein